MRNNIIKNYNKLTFTYEKIVDKNRNYKTTWVAHAHETPFAVLNNISVSRSQNLEQFTDFCNKMDKNLRKSTPLANRIGEVVDPLPIDAYNWNSFIISNNYILNLEDFYNGICNFVYYCIHCKLKILSLQKSSNKSDLYITLKNRLFNGTSDINDYSVELYSHLLTEIMGQLQDRTMEQNNYILYIINKLNNIQAFQPLENAPSSQYIQSHMEIFRVMQTLDTYNIPNAVNPIKKAYRLIDKYIDKNMSIGEKIARNRLDMKTVVKYYTKTLDNIKIESNGIVSHDGGFLELENKQIFIDVLAGLKKDWQQYALILNAFFECDTKQIYTYLHAWGLFGTSLRDFQRKMKKMKEEIRKNLIKNYDIYF